MRPPIRSHFELDVFKKAFDAAMELFEASKRFPREETYSLTDQGRRSSRSVCANLAEAWRKRIYEAAFVSKLNDSEAEAAETQTWVAFAVRCQYLDRETGIVLHNAYEEVLRMIVAMRCHPEQWTIPPRRPVNAPFSPLSFSPASPSGLSHADAGPVAPRRPALGL